MKTLVEPTDKKTVLRKHGLYTADMLKKKYKGRYIDAYPHHYLYRDKQGNWETVYEVRGTSSEIKENYNLPQDAVID